MPNPMTTRNATSVPAASAAGPTTAGATSNGGTELPQTGPLPQSALAEALARNFESQGAEETTSQVQPSGNEGQTEPELTQTEATDPATETQNATETTTGEEITGNEPEVETPTEEVPTEQPEPGAETETETEDEPIGVKKRIGALLKKIEDLESRLETATEKANTNATPTTPERPSQSTTIDTVTDVAELERREQVTMDGIGDADRLLALCTVRPQEVERELRAMGAQLKDDSGEEDYSPERMVNWLVSVKQMFNNTLRAIPRRRKYLALYEQEHTQALQLFPWLKDKADERHAMFQNMLSQAPQLKSAANHEYWVACAVRGHQLVQEELAKQRNGNGTRAATNVQRTHPRSAQYMRRAKSNFLSMTLGSPVRSSVICPIPAPTSITCPCRKSSNSAKRAWR
jgi:hypothetical protein